MKETPNPRHLGQDCVLPSQPDQAILDRVPNPHRDDPYVVRFSCPEFTSICPVTSQPDFAHLVIDYVPGEWLIESKSLKLYLGSYRNHGDFHEACTTRVALDIWQIAKPVFIRIGGYWYPRGGIPIDVFFQKGTAPGNLFLPEQGVGNYRGRG
jgi:7-cyano-7-deazaguanine reductase